MPPPEKPLPLTVTIVPSVPEAGLAAIDAANATGAMGRITPAMAISSHAAQCRDQPRRRNRMNPPHAQAIGTARGLLRGRRCKFR